MLNTAIVFATLIAATYTDMRGRKVSNRLVLFSAALVIICTIFTDKWSLLGMMICITPAMVIAIVIYLFGVGGGDVKLLIVVAFVVTPYKFLIILAYMFCSGALQSIYNYIRYRKTEPVPLVPGILLGYLITLITNI